jgi:hypothetical protein
MNDQSYRTTIRIANAPQDVFNRINDVSSWWTKDFECSSRKLNDEFRICHPWLRYSKQKLVEIIPGKKIVWLVTESKLDWIEHNKEEWTNTRMVFDINLKGDKTVLYFTHEGLSPEKESYARCAESWNIVIKDWLFNFITAGKTI